MIAVTGIRSRIVEELRKLLPPEEEVVGFDGRDPDQLRRCQRLFLCAGLLRPIQLLETSHAEFDDSIVVNLAAPMRICDFALQHNEQIRIALMGSESGFTWSHDGAYAAAKAALHRYVETKKLKPNQQLICVAPSIIEDTGMTQRRTDTDNLEQRRLANPKQRFLKAAEVAKMVYHLLYVDEGYTTGTVIRMNGGC